MEWEMLALLPHSCRWGAGIGCRIHQRRTTSEVGCQRQLEGSTGPCMLFTRPAFCPVLTSQKVFPIQEAPHLAGQSHRHNLPPLLLEAAP